MKQDSDIFIISQKNCNSFALSHRHNDVYIIFCLIPEIVLTGTMLICSFRRLGSLSNVIIKPPQYMLVLIIILSVKYDGRNVGY